MTTRISRRAIACALFASTSLIGLTATPAQAQQTTLINFPAEKFAMAPGGVDLRTGRYVYSNTDLAVGPADGAGALKLDRIMPDYAGSHANPFGSFSDNWDIFVLERVPDAGSTDNNYRLVIHMGGRAYTFEGPPSSTGTSYESDGPVATLTGSVAPKTSSAEAYTAQLPDGTTMVFRPIGNFDCSDQSTSGRRCAYVSQLTEADGTQYTFSYAGTGSSTGNNVRLTQVVSNRGYALVLEGSGIHVTKACVLNLTTTTLPSGGLCPPGVPTTIYSYGLDGKLASATDATGAVSQFTYTPGSSGTAMAFIKPGQSTPWLTNTYHLQYDEDGSQQEIVDSQAFADGRSYAYGYDTAPVTANTPNPTVVGGTSTDQTGHTITYRYDFPVQPGSRITNECLHQTCQPDDPNNFETWTYQQTPGPVLIEDELGRQTTADYCDPFVKAHPPATDPEDDCSVSPLQSYTDPEGSKMVLQYDNYRNITQSTRYPKPGSSLTPIVLQATYATGNIKTQTKPLSITDGNGNETDYTYDPNHGGVLTETKPAVNGIRPQTRYSYAQRSAWISNGSGGYVQAASPVWLLTGESFCKTSAWTGTACATAGDEVVTPYEYGPDSGPNNLLPRGAVVTADGQSRRTCHVYDAQGNRIAETKPNAGLTSCP
jgi:YD repeat-containing protein